MKLLKMHFLFLWLTFSFLGSGLAETDDRSEIQSQPSFKKDPRYISFAETVGKPKIQIALGNHISFYYENGESNLKRNIEYYVGIPLIVSCELILGEGIQESDDNSDINSKLIVTDGVPWKNFLKIYLLKSDSKNENILADVELRQYESPQSEKRTISASGGYSSLNAIYIVPGNFTENISAGSYKLFVKYENLKTEATIATTEKTVYSSNTIEIDFKIAVTNYQKAQVFYHKGVRQIYLENFEEADSLMQEAINICPEFPTPYLYKINICMQRRDKKEVEKYIEIFKEVMQTTTIPFWANNKERKERDLFEVLSLEDLLNN